MNGNKSYKREVAGLTLLAAAIVSVKFWMLTDPALVVAFSPAYNGTILVVVPSALAVFGMHFWRQNPGTPGSIEKPTPPQPPKGTKPPAEGTA